MLRTILRIMTVASFLVSQLPVRATAATTLVDAQAKETVEIPFTYAGNHLIAVSGSIGARENLTFLVDLGTTYTLIDRKFAAQLESGSSIAVSHFSNSLPANEVVLPSLTLGSLRVSDFHAYLADLTEMPAPAGVAGIIGADLLSRRNVTFDFASQKIVFSERALGDHQAPLEKCTVGFAIRASWKNRPVKLVLSNGVEVVTLDRDRISAKAEKLRGLKAGTVETNYSVTPVFIFKASELAVSGTRLKGDGLVRKMDWPVSSDPLQGFFPLTALHASRVTLDFEHGLLLWDSADDKIERAQHNSRPAAANSLRDN